jgi:ABC-2 type transport system permease protein
MRLLLTEMRRALHRRIVWVLAGLAVALSIVAGVVVFIDSADGLTAAQERGDELHPAALASWWVTGNGDGYLVVACFFLLIGALIGGASVAGAEWRAGTVGTVLTWEPRRTRLLLARLAAGGILATVIAVLLQVIFLAAAVPAVLANGVSTGVDAGWWLDLGTAVVRASLLTGLAAVLAMAIANLGRNTTAALAVVGGWLLVGEGLVRGLKPGWGRFLLGENLSVVLTWARLEGPSHSPGRALASLLAYTAIPVIAALVVFHRRDLVG